MPTSYLHDLRQFNLRFSNKKNKPIKNSENSTEMHLEVVVLTPQLEAFCRHVNMLISKNLMSCECGKSVTKDAVSGKSSVKRAIKCFLVTQTYVAVLI